MTEFVVGKKYTNGYQPAKCVFISNGKFSKAVLEHKDGSISIVDIDFAHNWKLCTETKNHTRYILVYSLGSNPNHIVGNFQTEELLESWVNSNKDKFGVKVIAKTSINYTTTEELK